jgi:hypothetical protein
MLPALSGERKSLWLSSPVGVGRCGVLGLSRPKLLYTVLVAMSNNLRVTRRKLRVLDLDLYTFL